LKNKLNELKKLVKSKCFFHALVLIILIIVAIFLYQMGFRITYAPDLETSWDAVSTVASWVGVLVSAVGVVASFIAIWYAIQVPKKIAEQQNKIALFEKRLECNKALSCLIAFSNYITNSCNTYRHLFFALGIFFDFPEIENDHVLCGKTSHNFIVNFQITILSGAYLFENYDVGLVQNASNMMQELITMLLIVDGEPDDILPKNISEYLKQLTQLCKKIEKNIIPSIMDEIAIDSIWE